MNLKDLIKEEQSKTLEVLEDARRLQEESLKRNSEVKELEAAKYREFTTIASQHKFFRQAHIDSLKIPYNICIHLSAKGSGKTTEIFRMMAKCLKEGERFLYGRVYPKELNTELAEFITDTRCPVVVVYYKDIPYLFDKVLFSRWYHENYDEETGKGPMVAYKKLIDAGIEPCGRCYTFFGSNTLSGGNYEGYTTIFFDEILSYSPINRVNESILHAWSASIHTIQRNKPEVKVYMMGNMQNVPEHPILSFYGIDIGDKLRIVKRGEKGETVILFINSGGLYKNTIGHKAGAAHHAGVQEQIFLKHNRIIKPSPTVLTPEIYNQMEHVFSFAINAGSLLNPTVVHVEFREKEFSKDNIVGVVRCSKLEISSLSQSEIWTDDLSIYNKFHNTSKRATIEGLFNEVYRLYKFRSLYFDSVNSLELFTLVVNTNQHLPYENQRVHPSLMI